MKKIELFERAIAEQAKSFAEYGINSTAFWALGGTEEQCKN